VLELETLSPLEPLAAGASIVHDETWAWLDLEAEGLSIDPATSSDADISENLVPRVRRVLG